MYDAANGSDLREVREWLEVKKEGKEEDYMYALAQPHGSCRGSSGSDMHNHIKN